MNLSANYEKMCAQSGYIQQFAETNYEDCFTDKNYFADGGEIWLPKQDQLIDMLDGKLTDKINMFLKFVQSPGNILRDLNSYTFEELWLMVVMFYKYNHIWNGVEWKEYALVIPITKYQNQQQ